MPLSEKKDFAFAAKSCLPAHSAQDQTPLPVTPFTSAIPGRLLQFVAHHPLQRWMICVSDGRPAESEGSLRSGFVTNSFGGQVAGGLWDSGAERRRAPGQEWVSGAGLSV